MITRYFKITLRVFLASAGLALTGCGPRTIEAGPRNDVEDTPVTMDWSDWALTLSRIVRDGRVDYRSLQSDSMPLDRFLARVARVGPESTPSQFADREARLAYAINAYNAAIVRSMVELCRHGKAPARVPFDFERRYAFRVDGRLQTPADLRRTALDLADGDWRVRMTLCDGTLEGPPLWRKVYLPDLLDAQLTYITKTMLVSPDVVRIDHGFDKRLLLWSGLFEIKKELVRDYEQRYHTTPATILNVLGEWSNRTRREELNTAVGYQVARMPGDDRINHFEPPSEDSGFLSIFSSLPGS